MPLYEYQCHTCGKRTEVLQRLDESPLTTCQECGGTLKKLISSPAFQFKGSGWYVTDYAGKKGADAKSETKPEAKSEGESKADKTEKTDKAEKPKETAAAKISGSAGSE